MTPEEQIARLREQRSILEIRIMGLEKILEHKEKEITSFAGSFVAMQDDMIALMELLKIGTYARTGSPHTVMVAEIIPAVKSLIKKP